jgi:UDP-glucose 4-epimerase
LRLVWVTGVCGFLGRNVARFFAEHGFEIAGIDRLDWPVEERKYWGVQHWVQGLINRSSLDQLSILGGLPEIVFHAAGTGSVGQSYKEPLEDFRNNVSTTAEVLEFMRCESPDTIFVLPSSAAVYGAREPCPISEESQLCPVSPYGFHKVMAEELCLSAQRNFGLRCLLIRYFSLYGPGLRKQLLWDLTNRLRTSPETVELFGTGRETRDMFYIEDAVRLAMEMIKVVGDNTFIVNGGSGCSMSVRQIASSVIAHLKLQTEIRFNKRGRPGDPEHYQADMGRAQSFGFRPSWSFDRGLAEYVRWLRSAAGLVLGNPKS